MNDNDDSFITTGEPLRFPSSEELRMVRAIAQLALLEAARHGEYRATFRGFGVQAVRQCSPSGAQPFLAVILSVSFGKTLIERGLVVTTEAGAMELNPCARVILFN